MQTQAQNVRTDIAPPCIGQLRQVLQSMATLRLESTSLWNLSPPQLLFLVLITVLLNHVAHSVNQPSMWIQCWPDDGMGLPRQFGRDKHMYNMSLGRESALELTFPSRSSRLLGWKFDFPLHCWFLHWMLPTRSGM